jgi:hypothetical protein
MTWVSTPDRIPHRCFKTRQGTEEHGPYLDVGLDFFGLVKKEDGKLGVNPKVQRLYLAARAIQAACEEPGSPMIALARSEYSALRVRHEEAIAALSAAEDRIRDLEEQLDARQAADPIDTEVLVETLVGRLDERYTRKRGPRKAA